MGDHAMKPCVSVNGEHHWAFAVWRRGKICVHCELRATMTDEEIEGEAWRRAHDHTGK